MIVMLRKPYKGSFADKVGRPLDELYLLEKMSAMDIGESFLPMLARVQISYNKMFGEELDFEKGLGNLIENGLVKSYINPSTSERMYSLSEEGKKYCKESGITKGVIESLKLEQISNLFG